MTSPTISADEAAALLSSFPLLCRNRNGILYRVNREGLRIREDNILAITDNRPDLLQELATGLTQLPHSIPMHFPLPVSGGGPRCFALEIYAWFNLARKKQHPEFRRGLGEVRAVELWDKMHCDYAIGCYDGYILLYQ